MRTLIVEDEMLLALQLEHEVESSGYRVIGLASDESEAIALVEREQPEFAFVDIHLRDGPTGIDIGRYLASRGIPFVFVSGNLKRIPADFAGALGAIEKPYSANGLQNALSYLRAVLSGEDLPPPPSSLTIFQ
ncbi:MULTISPECIES: response regulator [unclassified Ensifer]|uniref:response regulator n=1 Tax=unclassified Ensifer TaxID=2633371 RepID=UPI00071614F1|nr:MULTISPECIES: response regulator [unclassified Ensifer]KQX50170.1 response regulator [Ensifer sp. Root1298]KQX78649.1 response regulator [Ensifer sp. Root1312]KRC18191.1 response regulator [Ensifer sp. Root74]KRD63394.1 response regulator [Ensifer sp. Root954]MBD9597918.1 response regulator [Ensifer sp. ENS05]